MKNNILKLPILFQLPETALGGEDHPKKLQFDHIEAENHPNYPIVIEARTPETKDAWLEGVKEHVVDTGGS